MSYDRLSDPLWGEKKKDGFVLILVRSKYIFLLELNPL